MARLKEQILVSDPSDGTAKGFGPGDGDVPEWVREVAPRAELWADEKPAKPEPAKPEPADEKPAQDEPEQRKTTRRKTG